MRNELALVPPPPPGRPGVALHEGRTLRACDTASRDAWLAGHAGSAWSLVVFNPSTERAINAAVSVEAPMRTPGGSLNLSRGAGLTSISPRMRLRLPGALASLTGEPSRRGRAQDEASMPGRYAGKTFND
jgi:hypothetical protein